MSLLVFQVGGWLWANHPIRKKSMITETKDTVNSRQEAVDDSTENIPDDPEIKVVENMMSLGQS